MKKFLLPVIFACFFILESLVVELFSTSLFNSNWIVVPRFLMVVIFFLTIYVGKRQGIIYGFFFGLLFDIVYTEVMGVYLFMFPLVAYVVSQIMRILQSNFIVVILVTGIGIALLELGVYEMNYLIKMTNMDFTTFTKLRLTPTVVFNLIFSIIAIYPMKNQFEKYAEELVND